MPSIKTNMLAWNANRQLNITTKKNAKNSEKLSSGYRINRAADDAAGLAISEKMRRQIRGLHQGAENIQDGIGYVQTADGALNETQAILQRMNELAVKSANGTNTADDRAYIDQEVQALKEELDRIFDTTSFNEIKIWEPTAAEVIGYEKRQAVRFPNTSRSIDVTNDNCGAIAYGGYKLHAEEDKGVYVTWNSYDGKRYTSKTISWEKLEKDGYSFELSDYFGDIADDSNNALLYKDGDPAKGGVFNQQISFSVEDTATIDDIKKCIDGRTYSVSTSAYADARFEDAAGNAVSKQGVSIYRYDTQYDYSTITMSYPAYYASAHNTSTNTTVANSGTKNVHNFDGKDENFITPRDDSGNPITAGSTSGNLIQHPEAATPEKAKEKTNRDTDTWKFSFYMDGVGEVTAESTSIVYYAPSDLADDDEQKKGKNDCWWRWAPGYDRNGKWVEKYEKRAVARTVSGGGTLGALMTTLEGEKDSSKPGLLTAADNGGYIEIKFSLTSKDKYEYGLRVKDDNDKDDKGERLQGNSVGSFKIKIRVNSAASGETEQTVLNKINAALNDQTILDISTRNGGGTYDYATVRTPTAVTHQIDIPIYGGTCNFFVQAGAEAGQHIDITYDSLSLLKLGLADTNVLTVKDSDNAINEIKTALGMISEQRSTFGAYQNRLEHAKKINDNSVENTQYAESVIRDADIADEMMEYSINSILSQAGTSMLTQANQQLSTVLQLLQ